MDDVEVFEVLIGQGFDFADLSCPVRISIEGLVPVEAAWLRNFFCDELGEVAAAFCCDEGVVLNQFVFRSF
jgi:hypothetical protein